MGRYAVVDPENEVVVNVIVWDGEAEYDPGDGLELIELTDEMEAEAPVSPGYGYNPRARKHHFIVPGPELPSATDLP